MRTTLAATVGILVLGRTLPLLACGATPPPYYVVDQQAPSGTDTALNAPVVVTLKANPDGPIANALEPTLVLNQSGQQQALPVRALSGPPDLVWVPLSALAPNTRYEAHYSPGYEGIPETTWQFTTGESQTPALALEGALEVSLEAGLDPVSDCTKANECGGGCIEKGQRSVTKARVKLPSSVGGFPKRRGELHVTDERAFDFAPVTKTRPDPNEGHLVSLSAYADLETDHEILLTLPEEAAPYRPCFAFRATDARGDEALSVPLCLSQTFPAPAEPEDSSASVSCSFAAPAGGSSFALALVGLSTLIRRRRARNRL